MDIIVKGRRAEVSDKYRRYVEDKLAKLSKWERKGMTIDVEVSKGPNSRVQDERERVELTIHSVGPVIRGEASAPDRYAALDAALERVENRLRRVVDKRKIHRGNHTPVSVAAATRHLSGDLDPAPAAVPGQQEASTLEEPGPSARRHHVDGEVELDTQGDGPVIVREKVHRAKPMSIDQALHEMELVGHDFYLFHDEEKDAPSVVYRRKGFDYGVLRLVD
ncbi:ribosome-associated translation inhibitor RaiA [Spiractinospora alimapuensis]|uniref:ribosome hibernation-promoting factor, HPF/YfiA family n=1 Tax=Spiractinospora alimapuensis TaxID=2820884 RepID=UPI001F1834B9|nr:ribosome-associated translation inhibitor RaiA [Spiractinospora alimapuensis]QVQ54358.1 ribosome-associated translation inhibitor RaiA [Spiractinospora alimapuensis]